MFCSLPGPRRVLQVNIMLFLKLGEQLAYRVVNRFWKRSFNNLFCLFSFSIFFKHNRFVWKKKIFVTGFLRLLFKNDRFWKKIVFKKNYRVWKKILLTIMLTIVNETTNFMKMVVFGKTIVLKKLSCRCPSGRFPLFVNDR